MADQMEIIAEIGTAHGGDLIKAEELICAAAEAGADTVKFQMVFAEEIIHPRTGEVPLPGGSIPLFKRFRELEQPVDFFFRLKEKARQVGVGYLCTPFGIRSARECRKVDPTRIKIASPELNHRPLLQEIQSYHCPVILSTGVSRLADIEEALDIFAETRVTLLHCITAYPAPEDQYNLALLPLYRQLFGVNTGISDHSRDPLAVPLVSLLLGGTTIEKHFTLSNNHTGLDDPIALTPDSFKKMTQTVSKIRALAPEDRRAAVTRRIGEQRLKAVIGSGRKKLAASEAENYGRTNRSLHAMRRIEPGETLTPENTAILRTEKILRPGLAPFWMHTVLGKKASRGIPEGEGIRWEDLLS